MTDLHIRLGSLAVEIGVPILLLVIALKCPRLRSQAVTVLGAVLPFIVLYAITIVGEVVQGISPESLEPRFPVLAIFGMSFIAYCLAVVMGGLLSFLPWPNSLPARCFLGACSGMLIIGYWMT